MTRLDDLARDGEALARELAANRVTIEAARADPRFGPAHLDRHRQRHSQIMTRLRANKIQAQELISGG